jgi:hypothetical protein
MSGTRRSRPSRPAPRQRHHPQHLHHPLQIVGKHMEAHLRADPAQGLRQKMRRSHPRLDGPERMLDRLPPELHFFGCSIEPLLHGFEHALMFPSLDAPFLAGHAFGLERAILAGGGPVTMQGHAVLDGRKSPGQPFARRAAIGIVLGRIHEVRLCREFCATTGSPVPTMKVRWPANRTAAPDAIVAWPSTGLCESCA